MKPSEKMFCFMCVGVLFLLFCVSPALAIVKDGRIEEIPGFRFQGVRYEWNKVVLDIVNMTNRNAIFGGTMTFLDRRGNPVARVRLQSKKVAHNSMERYTGYCVLGTGESARRAVRVIWDFGPR